MAMPLLLALLLLLAGFLLVLNSLWLRPRWVEKQLRQQGFDGNSYRFMVGDMKEMAAANSAAWSKPMKLSHRNILSRADPFLSRTLQKYGKGRGSFMWFGTTARVVVWEPKMVTDILQDKIENTIFHKLPATIAQGIHSLEGDAWAKRRKAISPAFHLEKLKSMSPAFSSCWCKLVDRWQGLTAADGLGEIDVWPEFRSLTGDVISRTAFGSSFEEGKIIFELQMELMRLAVEAARASSIPGYSLIPTRNKRRRMQIHREIRAMLMAIIRKKQRALEQGEQVGDDLLSLLLQISNSSDNSYTMTTDDVIEECKLFYFAGHETTSLWLTWTAVLLADHQEWQQRAREEVIAVCGGSAPTVESLSHLKTLTMILYEALRLYPPAATLRRQVTRTARFGEVVFPAGVQIVLPVGEIQRSAELWGDDAEEFKPERFSEGVAKASAAARGGFFPFGWGPRICLGQSFAVMEAKMATASLLQRFSFHLSPAYAHAPRNFLTLQPQFGAHLIVRRIHQQ